LFSETNGNPAGGPYRSETTTGKVNNLMFGRSKASAIDGTNMSARKLITTS
jgi:hypothetical protein